METLNAFVGQTRRPTETEIAPALGLSAASWKQLVKWLAEQGSQSRSGSRSQPGTDRHSASSSRSGPLSISVPVMDAFASRSF
jgi:hypothetical protein